MTAVAVLGAGAMGRPMAANLARAGFDVRVWDPVPARAAGTAGTTASSSASTAAQGADVVMTMAPDGPAVESTMFGAADVVGAMAPGAVWLQTSTIGARWAERFAGRARERGLMLVDAPAIGSIPIAEAGELNFFAAGPPDARPRVTPLLDAMGARTYWYDAPGDGQRMKLVINGWILTLNELATESLAMAEAVGLDPRQFLQILDGHFVGSPLLQGTGAAIVDGNFEGGLRLGLAHKDLGLIIEAADDAGVDLALAPAARQRMQRAIDAGHADRSQTATWFVMRR